MDLPSEKQIDVSPEKVPDATIRLEFFRHDHKEKQSWYQSNRAIRLSDQGRIHASESGKKRNPIAQNGLAFASPRIRAQETALRHLLANEPEIGPEDSLKDIKNIIREKIGNRLNKIRTIKELDFEFGDKRFQEANWEALDRKRDYISFLINESDNLVRKYHDSVSPAYTRVAGRFSEIILKYLSILPRWKELVKNNPGKYGPGKMELQRFFCSHLEIVESFLLKVVEKTEGHEALQALAEKRRNGFGYSEGYTVTLSEHQGEPKIVLTYDGMSRTITPKLLKEMVDDKDKLNKETSPKAKGVTD